MCLTNIKNKPNKCDGYCNIILHNLEVILPVIKVKHVQYCQLFFSLLPVDWKIFGKKSCYISGVMTQHVKMYMESYYGSYLTCVIIMSMNLIVESTYLNKKLFKRWISDRFKGIQLFCILKGYYSGMCLYMWTNSQSTKLTLLYCNFCPVTIGAVS